jgi:lipopolysaccharide export system protein LptA
VRFDIRVFHGLVFTAALVLGPAIALGEDSDSTSTSSGAPAPLGPAPVTAPVFIGPRPAPKLTPLGPRSAVADSAGAAQEPYHLSADRLEGSAGAGENVYSATRVTVVHGATTVTGDSALVYREREFVRILGNVKIVDGDTRMWGQEATYDRKAGTATLHGNVRIEENGSKITGDQAVFYRTEDRSVITGHSVLRDSTRTVKADRIEYDRGSDLVTATGHVDAYDSAESTRVLANRVRYDRRMDYAWADTEPILQLTERDGKTTEVKSLALEFDNARRAVFAIGDVRIHREDLRAQCDRAEFYQNEDRAVLLGQVAGIAVDDRNGHVWMVHRPASLLWAEYGDLARVDGLSKLRSVALIFSLGPGSLLTAFLAAFGRAIAEVGAILIVGGNIAGFTRTMTTAIALETSKGDLPLAIGLGMVLIAIVVVVNAAAWGVRRAGERWAG